MLKEHNVMTNSNDFYKGNEPKDLIKKYGSPLYVYSEDIFRKRCREIKDLVKYDNFGVNYSVKANSNISLLKIAREEGLSADAMSPGEIYFEEKAGYKPEEILFISNNVSEEEMRFAISRGIVISVDSVSQLEMYGRLNKGGRVCIRLNSGVGDGHHEKVVTAGKKTKFGIDSSHISTVKEILKKYELNLVGINQHIGSLFMSFENYIAGANNLFKLAKQFDNLEFIDIGGGFGIPYHKQDCENRLDLKLLGEKLDEIFEKFVKDYGKKVKFKVEPGRYIAAESGVLLGTVHATKFNYGVKYVGTDLGFNILSRPMMYDSHHDLEIYRSNTKNSTKKEIVNVVGNICESGDIIAKERELPEIFERDIIGVMDAGAYGYCMASNYNNRVRPAEILIESSGNIRLIRRRDTLEDLVRNFDS